LKGYTILPKKHFYLILGPLAILIFILSIEILMRTKDVLLFEAFIASNTNIPDNLSSQELFNIYVTGNLSMYFQKIIIPIGLSIHTYFALIKLRINKLFVFMWTILAIGSLAYTITGLKFTNFLMYIYIVLYMVVVLTLLSLIDVISNSEQS